MSEVYQYRSTEPDDADVTRIRARIADYRRLYHHMVNGGEWNRRIDTARLSNAIADIERLAEENYTLRLASKSRSQCGDAE